jgi:tetratricopeptide (TPR) repeat protein
VYLDGFMSYLIPFLQFFFGLVGLVIAINLFINFRIPARVKKAEALFEEDQTNPALDIVNSVLERKKDYVPAMFLKAKILRRQRQFILAIAEANNILRNGDFKRYMSELDIHFLLADLYNKQQLYHKEIEEYKLILNISPTDITANHQLGLHYYKSKKYREARDLLIRALAGNPQLADCYLPLGIASYQISEYQRSEEYLLKTIETLPLPPAEAYYYLGLIYRAKRDNDNAIKMFEQTRKDPNYSLTGTLRIAEIHYEKEEYAKAIEVLESNMSALRTREDDSIAYRYLLAECYEMENQIKEAIHHWEKIESERPNYKSTQSKLADYKAIMNDDVMKGVFTASLESLQPIISEIIARLNFNIITKKTLSQNQLVYKAYNIKRINDPPLLIFFDRTTREVPESAIIKFSEMMHEEKCKAGIYIATSRFSMKAKSSATSEMIELLDKEFVGQTVTKIKAKQK